MFQEITALIDVCVFSSGSGIELQIGKIYVLYDFALHLGRDFLFVGLGQIILFVGLRRDRSECF